MVISATVLANKDEEGEGMQELRGGTSSTRTMRESEDEEAEAQGCGSVRAGFRWGKAGNSPRFSR